MGALTVDCSATCVDSSVTSVCNLEALRPFHMRDLFRLLHLRQTFVATSHVLIPCFLCSVLKKVVHE